MQTTEKSGLEQDLGQMASLVRAKRAVEAGQGEADLYAEEPYGLRTAAPGQTLPAPPVSPQSQGCPSSVLLLKTASVGSYCLCITLHICMAVNHV